MKYILVMTGLLFGAYVAQVKIGSNPTVISPNANLEVEGDGAPAEQLATDSALAIVTNCVVGGTTILTLPAGARVRYQVQTGIG